MPEAVGMLGVVGWRAVRGLPNRHTIPKGLVTTFPPDPGWFPSWSSEDNASETELDGALPTTLLLPDLGQRVFVPRLMQVRALLAP